MKIPTEGTQIKIGTYIYTVKFDKNIAAEGRTFGSTHHHTSTIFIDPTTSLCLQEETFLHELLHAVMFVNGLGYRFDKEKPENRPDEEELIRCLSPLLLQVINDNKDLFI